MQQAEKRTIRTILSFVLIVLLLVPSFLSIIPLNEQVLTGAAEGSPAPDNDNRPNIIVIMTDDQRWDTVQYMGNVSALAEQGITFNNSFVTNPLCCPSRSTFLTGLYTHNHGVWTNEPPLGGVTVFDDSSTLATSLNDTGYRTGLIGKYLNEYRKISPYIPPGWDEWQVLVPTEYYNYRLNENGQEVFYGNTESDYSTDVLRDKAIDFIQSSIGPFFLFFTPYASHGPVTPAPRHIGTCDSIPIEKLPSFNEAEVSDKPPWIANKASFDSNAISDIEEHSRDEICTLKAADEAVGAILASLGPRINNTIIIYTTDNGYLWGEHRLRGKERFYEEAIRVPLIIYSPNLLPGPLTINELVVNIDLAPTIAEFSGTTLPGELDGVSLLPLITAPSTANWRTDFLMESIVEIGGGVLVNSAAVRNSQVKYIEHYDQPPSTLITCEFYDLVNDPYELENSINNPGYLSDIEGMAARLAELKGRSLISDCTAVDNDPPSANAGIDAEVNEGTSDVILDGSASDDADGTIQSYQWEQVSGSPVVDIADSGNAIASFDAPLVAASDAELTFKLTVTDDDGAVGTDTVTVTVKNVSTQISTTLTLNIINGVPWGKDITVTGKLADGSGGGVGGKSIAFDGTGADNLPDNVVTNADGTFTAIGKAPGSVQTGWKVQAHFAGDSSFIASDSVERGYGTLKHVVSLTLTAPSSIPWGQPTKFTAILKDTSNGGTPISGKTIHYDGTGVSGVSDKTTDTSGKAIGTGTAPSTLNTGWKYQAHFAGDSLYQKKDSSINTYSTIKHTTTLTLIVSPTSVSPDGTYKVEGFLKDSTKGGTSLSSMTITFTAKSPITIPNKTTTAAGKFSATGLPAPDSAGTYDIQAHFAANTLYKAKDSALKTLTVQ